MIQSLCETGFGAIQAKHDTGRKETVGFAQHGPGALECSGAAPRVGSFQSVPRQSRWLEGPTLAPHAGSRAVVRSSRAAAWVMGADEGLG